MKTSLLLFCMICNALFAFGQDFQKPNYDDIRALITENGPNNYAVLYKRLIDLDTTLTNEHYYILYYGQCLQDGYAPYALKNTFLTNLLKENKKEEFSQKAKTYLAEYPFDLQTLDYLLDVLYESDKKAFEQYSKPFYGFMDAIFRSGEGTNNENPHHVMTVTDEYVFMRFIGVKSNAQKLVFPCDVMTLSENKYKIKQLFFDVSQPLKTIQNLE